MATQSSKLLDHARASEGETSQKLAEVRTARDAALLKSDGATKGNRRASALAGLAVAMARRRIYRAGFAFRPASTSRRIASARVAVLDRAWGKPGQSNDTQGRLTAGHSNPDH